MTFAVGCFVREDILYNNADVSRRNGGMSKPRTYYVRGPSNVDKERACVDLETLRVFRMPILVASILLQINRQFAQEMLKKSKN